MKKEIFIGWSGKRSKFVADELKEWIPMVIQNIKPWVSTKDIYVGKLWHSELIEKLERFQFGIFCITPENQDNPWMNFEAGALSKIVASSYICPYLINISYTELKGPFMHFQSCTNTEIDTLKLMRSINSVLKDDSLDDIQLNTSFKSYWPDLSNKLKNIPTDVEIPPKRSDSDMLQEILEYTRAIDRRLNPPAYNIVDFLKQDKKFEYILENQPDVFFRIFKFISDNPKGKHVLAQAMNIIANYVEHLSINDKERIENQFQSEL